MTTLARLSFWIDPAQQAEFAAIYEQKLVPLLQKHDLVESPEPGRRTADGVFSRLFEVDTQVAMTAEEKILRKDPAWQEALQNLAEQFPESASEGCLHCHWGPYVVPVTPGRTVAAGPGFRQGAWHVYGIQDGIPCLSVPAMTQDRKGHLWLAISDGICRYDGTQFTTFTREHGLAVADRGAMSVLEDREGRLWFGSEEGVTCSDGKEFVTFTTTDGLADDNVQVILEDREGNLWFGTGAFRRTLSARPGEGGRGVSRYDGEQFVSFTNEDGLAGDEVLSIVEDRDGFLWFGTTGGVSRYDGQRFESFTTVDGLANNSIWSILEDRDGFLWFGTWGGVSRYDGQRFKSFTVEDGLASDRVMSIVEDLDGNLWFGTVSGITRYDGAHIASFTTTIRNHFPIDRVESSRAFLSEPA